MKLFGSGKKFVNNLPVVKKVGAEVAKVSEEALTPCKVENELSLIAAIKKQGLIFKKAITPRSKLFDFPDSLAKLKLNPDENHWGTYFGHYVGCSEINKAYYKGKDAFVEFLNKDMTTSGGVHPSLEKVEDFKNAVYELCKISPELAVQSLSDAHINAHDACHLMVKNGLSLQKGASETASKVQYTSIETISEVFRALNAKINRLNAKGDSETAAEIKIIAERFGNRGLTLDEGFKEIHDKYKIYNLGKESHSIDSQDLVIKEDPKVFEALRSRVYRMCDEGTIILEGTEKNTFEAAEKIKQQLDALPNGSQQDELYFKILNTLAKGKEVPGFGDILNPAQAIESGSKAHLKDLRP